MIPAWLSLVLDRLLPELTGGQRDDIARAIVAAIPLSLLELAIVPIAARVLTDAGTDTDIILDAYPTGAIARKIARLAAPRIAVALLEAP